MDSYYMHIFFGFVEQFERFPEEDFPMAPQRLRWYKEQLTEMCDAYGKMRGHWNLTVQDVCRRKLGRKLNKFLKGLHVFCREAKTRFWNLFQNLSISNYIKEEEEAFYNLMARIYDLSTVCLSQGYVKVNKEETERRLESVLRDWKVLRHYYVQATRRTVQSVPLPPDQQQKLNEINHVFQDETHLRRYNSLIQGTKILFITDLGPESGNIVNPSVD